MTCILLVSGNKIELIKWIIQEGRHVTVDRILYLITNNATSADPNTVMSVISNLINEYKIELSCDDLRTHNKIPFVLYTKLLYLLSDKNKDLFRSEFFIGKLYDAIEVVYDPKHKWTFDYFRVIMLDGSIISGKLYYELNQNIYETLIDLIQVPDLCNTILA
jgi:hypothetical protein